MLLFHFRSYSRVCYSPKQGTIQVDDKMFWSGPVRVEYNRVGLGLGVIKFTTFGFSQGRGKRLESITRSGCQKPCLAGL